MLAPVPGPEDLVLMEDRRLLLVSSLDRRADRTTEGSIWSVSVDGTSRSRELEIDGRHDGCSFRPHGIDLVRVGRRSLLYVINHHDPDDLAPDRGCFDAPGKAQPRARVTSVEVFEVGPDRLRFLQRLADPEILTHGNDLVVDDERNIWVSVPPPGRLAQLADSQGWPVWGFGRSKVVRFVCDEPADVRCTGQWENVPVRATATPRFANGIEIRKAGDVTEVYLASSGDGRVIRTQLTADDELRRIGEIDLEGIPDNLSWDRDGDLGARLLVAVHPEARRLLQHGRSPATPAPSSVVRLTAGLDDGRRPIFEDSGGRVSAASVAVAVGDDLILGQRYDSGVVRCRPDPRSTRPGGGR